MTTFKHRGWLLLQVAAIVATVHWPSGANADSVESPSSATPHATPQCNGKNAVPASDNRYVLLLFFDKDPMYLTKIQTAFGYLHPDQDIPKATGCIMDPDALKVREKGYTGGNGIIVQGGCPTDCVHRQVERAPLASAPLPGDPLSRLVPEVGDTVVPDHKKPDNKNPGHKKPSPKNDKLGWGIFFADADQKADAADDDKQTTFRVWKILARDSCHAGKILYSLYQNPVFASGGPFRGQIMIGYTPPLPHPTGAGSTTNCASWKPK
jgi:hypothetical protein